MRNRGICNKPLLPHTFYCPCHCFVTTRPVHYSHYLFIIFQFIPYQYITMIAQLGLEYTRTLALWCAVLSLFCFSTVLSCALGIEGITGEEDSRWLRRHAAKENGYRFACDVIAGKTSNPSNWPYFRLGLFCASTCYSHWYERWFEHVHFRRHWVALLPQPWFTLRNCVTIAYVITCEASLAS